VKAAREARRAEREQKLAERKAEELAQAEVAQKRLLEEVPADDPIWVEIALERIRREPWWWIEQYVYTYDSHDDKERIKRFPIDKPYFRPIMETIMRDKVVFIVKSRQMMMSWLLVTLCLWKSLFFERTEAYVQCLNEDVVNYFLERAAATFKELPDWQKLNGYFKVQHFKVPQIGSFFSGIPSGSAKGLSRVPSVFVGDELAKQDEGQASVEAILPAIAGDAWFIGNSTPFGKNFYERLAHPKKFKAIETVYPIDESPKTSIVRYPGYTVIFLHYTADPAKRTKEWYEAERSKFFAGGGTEEGWRQYYEMDFDVGGNPKLFPQYDPKTHEVDAEFNPFLPVVRGWDFGFHRPACVFWQKNEYDQVVILDAILGHNWDIHEFVGHVLDFCNDNFKPVRDSNGRLVEISYQAFCDPAGTQEKDTGSTVKILRRQYRIHPRSRYSRPEERARLIADRLKVRSDGKPGLVVNRKTSGGRLMASGFRGGFQSKPDVLGQGTGIPLKDGQFEHLLDAFGYSVDLKLGVRSLPKDPEWERIQRRKRRRREQQYRTVTGYTAVLR